MQRNNDIMDEITILLYALCFVLFVWCMFEWMAVIIRIGGVQ